jgi:two-component system cell cycle sensor histidine kinase/response regulator CckA
MRFTPHVQGQTDGMSAVVRAPKPQHKKSTSDSHEESTHRPPQSSQYSALVARATNDAVRIWNVKSGELSWPEGLEHLLGATNADTGKIAFWQQHIHPADRNRTATSIRDALNGDTDRWSGEYRLRRADGSYADVLERASIDRNADGVATQFVGSLMDITARKHLHDQLSRAQKMEAFGQLAGGMAHDFNNFLTAILGYSDLLLNEMSVKGAVANHISEIRNAANRASALTSQLLAFSRKHPLMPNVLEVNSIITKLERSLLRLLGEDIRVRCELHDEKHGAHIQVDSGELSQVLINLAINARDAMPRGGTLVLRTAPERVVEEKTPGLGCDPLPPGDYVAITVADNGCGMSDEAKAHLFEPFFSTKSSGSGLGLATTFGIVRQSGGHIYVASEPNHGTIVTVYLPRVSPPASNYKKPALKKLPGGNETILLLEDDVSVRHLSVRVLRLLGYHVIEAANGDDAQRLIDARKDTSIDLLLTDIMMPDMSGHDFAAWLEKTSPHTKVVFVSGYLDQSLRFAEHWDHALHFLPKPFDPEQLALKIRHALDN